jgi:gliding motility-associated-like protein
MKNTIENLVKNSLDKHEMPYDAKAWDKLKNNLPSSSNRILWTSILTGSIAAISLVAWFYFDDTTPKTIVENPIILTENKKSITTEEERNTVVKTEDSNSNIGAVKTNTLEFKKEIESTPIAAASESNDKMNTSPKPVVEVNRSEQPILTPSVADLWLAKAEKSSAFVSATSICKGESVVLKVNQLPEKTNVTWVLDNGTKVNGAKITLDLLETTSIKPILKHEQITYNLEAINVVVNEPIEPYLSVKESIKNTKPYYVIENSSSEIVSLSWLTKDGRTKANRLNFYGLDKGNYSYTVESVDVNGCKFKKEDYIYVPTSYNLFAENTFSPNGDGINESFIPRALQTRDVGFKMTIFDRSGTIMYETTQSDQPWDGTTFNGSKAQIGNYMWVVTLINEDGHPERYSGAISILER